MGYDDNYPPPSLNLTPTRHVQRYQRRWPALLTLYLLSPIIGEVLSGSTPPLMFLNPISLLYQTALYGSGAILVRELVRRRGLGWDSIVLLGAAYGILEEGLVVTSWFNPYWPDLGFLAHYGRFLDTSWVWAVELTVYHAVVSITMPIVLVELLFPRIAAQPWLGKRGFRAFIIWLTLTSLVGLLGFGFLFSRAHGYTHPPLMYLGALLLAVGFVWLGLHMRPRIALTPGVGTGTMAPGLWRLRLLAFLATIAFFFVVWALPSVLPFPVVPVLLVIALVIVAVSFISTWSRRIGWGAQHRLALVSGVLSFFVLLSPLVEFAVRPPGKIVTGQALFGLLVLVLLIIFAWWVKRQVPTSTISPNQYQDV